MNKTEFTAALATVLNVPNTKAAEIVTVIFDADEGIISKALVGGDEVKITGFGNFTARARAARAGINPKTKEAITVPSSVSAKFSVGKNLKERLNNRS